MALPLQQHSLRNHIAQHIAEGARLLYDCLGKRGLFRREGDAWSAQGECRHCHSSKQTGEATSIHATLSKK